MKTSKVLRKGLTPALVAVSLLIGLLGIASPASANHTGVCSNGISGRTASATCHGPGVVGLTVRCSNFGFPFPSRYTTSKTQSIGAGYVKVSLTCVWPYYPETIWSQLS